MVTKAEFEEAYRKFPPSKCELFFMKYISIHSVADNKWIFLIPFVLLLPFLTELIFCSFKLPEIWKIIPSCVYMLFMTIFATYCIMIYLKKKKRLVRIRMHLGVSKKEYQDLINMHYYHRYPSAEKYIKFNSK